MEPARAEVEVTDEKATTAATGSASAEEEGDVAETKPASGGEKGLSETGAGAGGATSSSDVVKGQESSSDAAGLWMYLDGVNPTQHGPLAESVMLKLLRIGTAHKDMMAWSQGMSEWKPLGQVSLVVSLIVVYFPCVLFYLGSTSQRRAFG